MAHRLINAQNVRELALAIAREERPVVGFERVSEALLDQVEMHIRIWLRGYIRALPSVGKTIK